MPRSPETVFANMSFNAHDERIRRAVEQAEANHTTLGTYLKKLVLALLCQGPVIPLQYQEESRVLAHVRQEAAQLEQPLESYILMLLADRDRALYSPENAPVPLWFPCHSCSTNTARQSTSLASDEREDDVKLEEALQNIAEFLADMTQDE
jgi:hypothetical protein